MQNTILDDSSSEFFHQNEYIFNLCQNVPKFLYQRVGITYTKEVNIQPNHHTFEVIVLSTAFKVYGTCHLSCKVPKRIIGFSSFSLSFSSPSHSLLKMSVTTQTIPIFYFKPFREGFLFPLASLEFWASHADGFSLKENIELIISLSFWEDHSVGTFNPMELGLGLNPIWKNTIEDIELLIS